MSDARPLREGVEIRDARPGEVEELLPLMRGYADFYEVSPTDDGLREVARRVIAEPEHGALFIARGPDGAAVGFAAMHFKWAATAGGLAGHLEDLFVDPAARGGGIADALIAACADRCRERRAVSLGWITATDNQRAQAVYDRVGAVPGTWVEYELELD